MFVKYLIETDPDGKKRLRLYERTITINDYFSDEPMSFDTDGLVFVEALENLRFDFLIEDSDGTHMNWTTSWQPQNMTDLPRAVRITYRDEKGRHNVRVIARMYHENSLGEEI